MNETRAIDWLKIVDFLTQKNDDKSIFQHCLNCKHNTIELNWHVICSLAFKFRLHSISFMSHGYDSSNQLLFILPLLCKCYFEIRLWTIFVIFCQRFHVIFLAFDSFFFLMNVRVISIFFLFLQKATQTQFSTQFVYLQYLHTHS